MCNLNMVLSEGVLAPTGEKMYGGDSAFLSFHGLVEVLIGNGLPTMCYIMGSRIPNSSGAGKYKGYLAGNKVYVPWQSETDETLEFGRFQVKLRGYSNDDIVGLGYLRPWPQDIHSI